MTISNIQVQLHVNKKSKITRKDLIYDVTNPDKSVDKVVRLWVVIKDHKPKRPGVVNQTLVEPLYSRVKEPARARKIKFVTNWLATVEKTIGAKKFPDLSAKSRGAQLSRTRIQNAPSAKASSKPVYATAASVVNVANQTNAELEKLRKEVTALAAGQKQTAADKVKLQKELAAINKKIDAIRNILVGK